MNERKPSDLADRIVVRMPDGMRKRLNDLARANGRTANAEAVKALEAWFANDPAAEPAYVRLPEQLRKRIDASAQVNGRGTLDEIIARLADSFEPEGPRHVEGAQLDIRTEIRDAMQEAVEGLLADPERLKRLGYTPPKRGSD